MQVRRLVPMAFVSSVPRALEFYAKLGFVPDNTFAPADTSEPHWAYLSSGECDLMLAKASEPIVAAQQTILFYVYVDDVAAAHAELETKGVDLSPLKKPYWAPGGEFKLVDPDGYVIMVSSV